VVRLTTALALVTLLLSGASGTPALADGGGGAGGGGPGKPDQGKVSGSLGTRLLEAPVKRRDDPRARVYIVDHVKPGTTFSRRIEIRNTSPKPQLVSTYPAASRIKDGAWLPEPGRQANELSSWITIDKPEFVAPPRSRTTIKATIAVPDDVKPGERYAVIWSSVASPKPGPTANVQLINRVGIRVYLDVGQGEERASDFEISDIRAGRTDDGHPRVRATVANTGGRALEVGGSLSLADGPAGQRTDPVRSRIVANLSPGDTASIDFVLDDELPDGPWGATLVLEGGKVRHTATATLTFPRMNGVWGLAADLDAPLPLALSVATGLAAVAALALVVTYRRTRRRPRFRGAA
jgi:hypothetical protein